MTDRINLAELRARELAWSRKLLTREEFDALLDAVEAAAVAIPVSACDVDGACPHECQDGCVRIKAFEALDRFEFGEAA